MVPVRTVVPGRPTSVPPAARTPVIALSRVSPGGCVMNTVLVLHGGSHRRPWCGAARLGLVMVALSLAAASCGGPAPRARGTPAATGSAPVNSLRVRPCTVDGVSARCGTLIVPENRLTGTGRTIPVRFVVIPAFGRDRAPDPVVYFAGGPGGSAVAEIRSELPNLKGLNDHRDLVFIEQRGTGQSNPLTCPAFPGAGSSTAK